jgi:hypothetical protein
MCSNSLLLNILTAVSRPENLPALEDSIFAANDLAPDVDVEWHRWVDMHREFVGGQHPKNIMLDRIELGWVCILDDDTIMHPQFLRKVYKASRITPYAKAIVVSQKRTTGVVLQACPDNMKVGSVDAGQVVLRRDFVGDLRIPETYAGDGEWIEALLRYEPSVVFLPEVLSLHNALSGVDVSETPERMGA